MGQQRRLSYVLAINGMMITGLVLVGFFSNSISILAAGVDFIADSMAIVLGILAVHLRDKHGSVQAPTYVALLNGVLLLGVTTYVFIEAIARIVYGNPEVHGLPVLVIATIATLSMVLSAFILGRGAGHEDLHMRSVLLDTLSDGLSAAAVAVTGGVIYFTHRLYWLDSATAIILGLVIAYGAIALLRDVARELQTKRS